jgi:hypothetical protein
LEEEEEQYAIAQDDFNNEAGEGMWFEPDQVDMIHSH